MAALCAVGLSAMAKPAPGCEGTPWEVGGTAGTTDLVVAWTNDTELVVQGTGTVTNLADVAKDGLTAITVTKATVTGAEAQAFLGIGAVGAPVALKLPDGWMGALPDQDGKWYGAFAMLTGYPFMVKNVTFQQRYPWNVLVDIAFNLTGVGHVHVAVSAFTNDVKAVDVSALEGKTAFDLGEGAGAAGRVDGRGEDEPPCADLRVRRAEEEP